MMRAIDVDKLEWFQVTFGAYQQKAIMILKPHICDLGIIEAEPVRHGKWEWYPKENCVICSECKEEHYLGTYHQYSKNYCPNCGAKMDLE